jgi:carboxynorspermidine decarboxylase
VEIYFELFCAHVRTCRLMSTNLNEYGVDPAAVLQIADQVETPAFVLDEKSIRDKLAQAAQIRKDTGLHILYALKPLGHVDAVKWLAEGLDGLAASSLFEAKLSREVVGTKGVVSITSPGLRPDEIVEIASLCDHVVCNSLAQYRRFQHVKEQTCLGLRINPQYSLVEDSRYDPCRDGSKLGEPLENVIELLEQNSPLLRGLRGLHFHSNCDSESFAPLLETVEHLHEKLGPLLHKLEWMNLGGGYLLESEQDRAPLYEAVKLLRSNYPLRVFMEPGAAFVREAGYIIASVIDLFESDEELIAVLDTTVNHMPEVFEYRFEPDLLEHSDDGEYEYSLAGSTCLSMDMFGQYCFDKPLEIGSRVIFPNIGAYSMVKAHMFNGVNLPTNYSLRSTGELILRQRFTYEDFLVSRCEGSQSATRIRTRKPKPDLLARTAS